MLLFLNRPNRNRFLHQINVPVYSQYDVLAVFGTCWVGRLSFNTLHPNTHHIFLSTRRCVVLTDLQLQHIPLPVEGKTAKEFHHGALVSERGVKD